MPEDEFTLTIASADTLALSLSDQGVAIPAAHATSHAAAGSDPITLSVSQVSGLGTMATQPASSVSITGGYLDGVTLASATVEDATITDPTVTGGSITGITDLLVADGGTGASTASAARSNLGITDLATQAASAVTITGGSITGITDLLVADGGTGASTAADARTNLGLGTIATQAASSVSITGGSVTGITDLMVADGGTGASTAAAARSNLDVPATNSTIRWRSDITDFTGGASSDLDSIDISNTATWPTGACISFTVSGSLATYRLTATGASENSPLIIRPDSYGGREWTLVSLLQSNVAITGGTITGVTTVGTTAVTAFIGDSATMSGAATIGGTLDVAGETTLEDLVVNGGLTFSDIVADSLTLTTDLAIADGGTGASSASAARTNLGFFSGQAILSSGTITVSAPGVTTGSDIVVCYASDGFGTQGILTVSYGTDEFTVDSTEVSDANDVSYIGIY